MYVCWFFSVFRNLYSLSRLSSLSFHPLRCASVSVTRFTNMNRSVCRRIDSCTVEIPKCERWNLLALCPGAGIYYLALVVLIRNDSRMEADIHICDWHTRELRVLNRFFRCDTYCRLFFRWKEISRCISWNDSCGWKKRAYRKVQVAERWQQSGPALRNSLCSALCILC